MTHSVSRVERIMPIDSEEWMTSLAAERAIGSANPENPASVVSAIRFLLQMSVDLEQHGNYLESINCAESALLLRHVNNALVQPLLEPLIADGLVQRGRSTLEEAESLVLRCNGYAVRAFNDTQFDVAEFFLGKALFLTDVRGVEEINFFTGAETRRLRLRAATLNNLGCMEKRRKRLGESLTYLRQAVELEVSLDSTSRGSPSTYLNLCTVLNELYRHDEAVNAAECAIAALEEQLPRQTKDQLPACAMMLVVGLYNLGVSLERRARTGDDVKARTSYHRALEASRKYFVDPNCPTVELAMAAIRHMHAASAFRADQVETTMTSRKHIEGPTESWSTLQPQQQEQLTSTPAVVASCKRSGSTSTSDVHLRMQPKVLTPLQNQQSREQEQQKQQQQQQVQKPQVLMDEEEEQCRLRSEKARQQLLDSEQRIPVLRLLTPIEAVVPTEGQVQRSHPHSAISSNKSSLNSMPFRSLTHSITESTKQTPSGRGSLAPMRPHTIPVPQQPCQKVLRTTSVMELGARTPASSCPSLKLPNVLTGDKKQLDARPVMLAPIRRPSGAIATPVERSTEGSRRVSAIFPTFNSKSTKKPLEPTVASASASVSNPFGRRLFGSSIAQSHTSSSSQQGIKGAELTALEKHVQRTSIRKSKEEEKRKRLGSFGRRGSALDKAKEREMKRQAREEEKNDAEMAEELYTRFVSGMRAEQLARCNRAAIFIQRNWRGCLARTLLRCMITAAKRIQRVFRAFLLKLLAARRVEEERLARLRAEQEKRELEAAFVLQVRVRQFLRRLEIRRAYLARKMQRHYAARRIQRGYHAFLKWREEHMAALMEAQRLEDDRRRQMRVKAATRIQRAYSRYLKHKEEQRELERQKQRERAAATIQALVRGVLARAWFRYYKSYRREQELKSAANQKRITAIQSAARVLLAGRLRRKKEMNLTQRFREFQLRRAATKIQCQWRNRIARIKFERLRAEKEMRHRRATRIQRWYATCVMRRKFLELCEANRRMKMAKKIQCWFRDCKERIKEKELSRYYANVARQQRLAYIQAQAIVFLQAWGRCSISSLIVRSMRSSFLRLTLCAEEFQRLGRGYAGRRATYRKKCQAIHEAIMRVEHDRQVVASCVIQRAWRCAMSKDTVEQMRRHVAASTCISRHYRGYVCRKELQRLRNARKLKEETRAVLVMQRTVRQFLQRLELIRLDKYYREKQRKKLILMRREEAATTLQAAWRGRATRMALERERKALETLAQYAVKIQRTWRARKFRLNINATVMRRSKKRVCRNRAALTLQCFWRKMMAAEKVACLRESERVRREKVVIIQCWWRRVLAKWELKFRRAQREEEIALQLHYMSTWDAMATLINTVLRVRSAQELLLVRKRKQLLNLLTDRDRERFLRRHTAATKIQAIYRGHYERVYARGVRREKEEQERRRQKREVLERRSAVIIQCAYRSWRAIREANARRTAKREKALEEELEYYTTTDPQNLVQQLFWVYELSTKRDLVKERLNCLNKRLKAASVIQKVVRLWLSKRRLEELRRGALEERAATIIQSYWKKFCTCEMQKALERKRRAAVIIQARFRGSSVRRKWKQWREHLAYEKQHQVLEEEIYDRAVVVLQSCWRGITTRRMADGLREQRHRDKVQQMLDEAACTVQRAYRRYRKRRDF